MPFEDKEYAKVWERAYRSRKWREGTAYKEAKERRSRKYPKTCDRCGAAFPSRYENGRCCGRTCSAEWMWENGLQNQMLPSGVGRYVGGGRARQHRWVMEAHLGRPLLPTESVHHINGDKADNRLENLVVLTRKVHARHHMTHPRTD